MTRDVDVCVVGAGPHGLAVVAHLLTAQPSLRERIAVVDPSGTWLQTWRHQFDQLEIDVLRSPIVHHPDVEPGALARYVGDERLPRSGLPYDPPLTSTFDSFCTRLVDRLDLGSLPTRARVLGIAAGDPLTITTDDGTIRARHVVWTGNTALPVLPDAFAGRPAEQTRIRHGNSVDVRSIGSLDGCDVAVLGGGLTAGHLVAAACARRATTTLITRRPIVERDFDLEPGWLGPKYLAGYARLADADERLTVARAARGGGTMPGWMHRRLSDEIARGRLRHLVGEPTEVRCSRDEVTFRIGDEQVSVEHCWSATGTRPHVDADPALSAVVEQHVDGVPVVDTDLQTDCEGLFVTGRLATIELGPAAGNLWGARMAARRITRAVTGIDLDDDAAEAIAPPVLVRGRRRGGADD